MVQASDKVGAAIAAASEQPATRLVEVRVNLPTGRPSALLVPHDLQAFEAVALIGYIATQLPEQLHKAASPARRLVIPGGPIPRA